MQTYFEEELAKLRKQIIKMFSLVDSQLEKAFQQIINFDNETLVIGKQNENQIDHLDIKIDKLCQRIFALAQPVATDLRFIMASLKIGNEIERIGDIAYDIIKRSNSVSIMPEILNQFKITDLSNEMIKLHRQVIEAYTNNNSPLAQEIITKSKGIEEICKSIFNQIVTEMVEKSQVIVVATDLIIIMRNLERVIGHISNIAESIIFIVDGKIIKHPNAQKKNAEVEK